MSNYSIDSAETLRMLDAAANGDETCVDGLFERHLDGVKQAVRRRLRPQAQSRFDASDVIQDTHQQARQQLGDYLQRRPMPFRLWLLRTAHQRLISLERFHLQAAKRSANREIPLPDNSSLDLARLLLTGHPTPLEQAALREEARVVRTCLAQLSEPDREVLLLRTFDNLSNAEVAMMLEQNPETTKKRFARALLKMKRLLREAGLEESRHE